ncbi:hypothetical protein BDN72DRAFT_539940 [Pluteus cervinus]|uniref:Uncharacterized protein n=1 Tax=Pluteus cervinus TaxID=181527 RepID=A0ACD3AXB2_9AGAR|nr:hypothetical protein BDN72DRAFT_539940 [Pluteus cervinus]
MPTTTLSRSGGASVCSVALGNHDILGHIFKHALLSYSPSSQELSRLAFVCKDVLEQVLDYAWSTLGSLLPLLRILPAFQKSGSYHGIARKIDEAEWSRFDYYARRVREINYTSAADDSQCLSAPTCIRLAYMHSRPLLPALRRLAISSFVETDLHWLYLCLSPTLDSVQIAGVKDVPSAGIYFFLSALADDAPALFAFEFTGQFPQEHEALSPVSRMRNIRTFKILEAPCPDGLLEQMSHMTKLTNLSITLSTCPVNLSDTPLDCLRELRISCPVNIINDFLLQLSAPRLARLNVCTTPPNHKHGVLNLLNRPGSIQGCLVTLCKRWPTTLQQLVITDTSDYIQSEGVVGLVSHLMQLTKLEHFDLQPVKFSLPGVDLLAVAACWEKITYLSLPFPLAKQNDAMTLQDLGMFASLCPLLNYLQIYLNTSVISPFVTRPPTLSQLRTLSVGSTHGVKDIKETLEVARYIEHYFQFLERIEGHNSHNKNSWSQIMDAVRMFQAVRADAKRTWPRKD